MPNLDTSPTKEPTPQKPPLHGLGEVRYSLPDLLNELQLERTTSSFSMEKLHQQEISNLFRNRKNRSAATHP